MADIGSVGAAERYLEIGTPIGRLVASTALSDTESQNIEVSLEKPDGTSGQVAMIEVRDVRGVDPEGSMLHTFVWDGDDEFYTECIDCNPDGDAMQFEGYTHGLKVDRETPKVAMGSQSPARIDPFAALEAVAGEVIERNYVQTGVIAPEEMDAAVAAFCGKCGFNDACWEDGLDAAYQAVVETRDLDDAASLADAARVASEARDTVVIGGSNNLDR